MQARIHITGASGSGATTLGRAVAQHLALPHFDTDDFYWLPVEPVYSEKRDPEDRIRLMQELFAPRQAWVLSGSLMGWGDTLRPLFDIVVFLRTPMEERLARLRQREVVRFGTDAIGPGGVFFVFAGCNAVALFVVGRFLPETKDRTLEELESLLHTADDRP